MAIDKERIFQIDPRTVRINEMDPTGESIIGTGWDGVTEYGYLDDYPMPDSITQRIKRGDRTALDVYVTTAQIMATFFSPGFCREREDEGGWVYGVSVRRGRGKEIIYHPYAYGCWMRLENNHANQSGLSEGPDPLGR